MNVYGSTPIDILEHALDMLGMGEGHSDEVLALVADLRSANGAPEPLREDLPYRTRSSLLSHAEARFFSALEAAVSGHARVFSKIRLSDILSVPSTTSQKWSWFGRINGKHVDFLLVTIESFRPLAAVELDDRSHQSSDRAARDSFVDEAFRAAGLPLIRIPAQSYYDIDQLRTQLETVAFRGGAPAITRTISVAVEESPQAPAAPTCPRCGATMVLRSKKNLPDHQFWGCSNFPTTGCRGIMQHPSNP